MSYKVYKEYENSSIDWIGDIPVHWTVKRIKDCLQFNIGGTPPTKNNEYFEGDNIWVSIADLSSNNSEYIYESSVKISNEGIRNSNVKLIKKGSLLYSFKLSVGLTAFAGCDLYTNEAIASFEQNNIIDLNFLKYVFKAGFENNANINIYGARLFNSELINFSKFVMPKELEEQQQIANYLDKKTDKIDETISKNKQLIELLEEKKASLINQVVTKGLNPNVPMKDSGVEWIGEIPEHWNVVPLTKFLESLVDYRGKTPEKVDEGIFLVTGKNIKKGNIYYNLSQEFVKAEDYDKIMSRGKPKVGDLLFTTEAPLGEVANIDNPKVALAQRIIKMCGKENVLNNYYLKYYMMSATFQSHLQSLATGSTAQGIKASKLFMLKLLLMPYQEQQDIAQYLDDNTKKIDNIIHKVNKNINLLEEYKTSLIHHVVTGKIDVRSEKI